MDRDLQRGEAQFVHQGEFLGSLPQLGFPVVTTSRVFVGERGGVIGQPRGLCVGFFGGVDVLVAIPEPLMGPVGDRAQIRQAENRACSTASSNQAARMRSSTTVSRWDCSTRIDFEIRLMIEPPEA